MSWRNFLCERYDSTELLDKLNSEGRESVRSFATEKISRRELLSRDACDSIFRSTTIVLFEAITRRVLVPLIDERRNLYSSFPRKCTKRYLDFFFFSKKDRVTLHTFFFFFSVFIWVNSVIKIKMRRVIVIVKLWIFLILAWYRRLRLIVESFGCTPKWNKQFVVDVVPALYTHDRNYCVTPTSVLEPDLATRDTLVPLTRSMVILEGPVMYVKAVTNGW